MHVRSKLRALSSADFVFNGSMAKFEPRYDQGGGSRLSALTVWCHARALQPSSDMPLWCRGQSTVPYIYMGRSSLRSCAMEAREWPV